VEKVAKKDRLSLISQHAGALMGIQSRSTQHTDTAEQGLDCRPGGSLTS